MSTKEVHKIKVRSLGCGFCSCSDEYVETTVEVTAGLSDGVIWVDLWDEECNSERVESTVEPIEFTLKDLEKVPINLLEAALAQAKEHK